MARESTRFEIGACGKPVCSLPLLGFQKGDGSTAAKQKAPRQRGLVLGLMTGRGLNIPSREIPF
jgi:hypothetical protein